MPKNQVPFQRGYRLPEFLREYGREEPCRAALFQGRWPQGFICPGCGSTGYGTLQSRSAYPCHRGHRQTSLIRGTLLESTQLPLTTWLLTLYWAHPDEKRPFGLGAQTPARELVPRRLAREAHVDARDERAR